ERRFNGGKRSDPRGLGGSVMAGKKALERGGFHIPKKDPPPKLSSEQLEEFVGEPAHEPASLQGQAHEPASSRHPAREPASLQKRSACHRGGGMMGTPYTRSDGTQKRSTIFHLPMKVHDKLRRNCFERGMTMSQFDNEADEKA